MLVTGFAWGRGIKLVFTRSTIHRSPPILQVKWTVCVAGEVADVKSRPDFQFCVARSAKDDALVLAHIFDVLEFL